MCTNRNLTFKLNQWKLFGLIQIQALSMAEDRAIANNNAKVCSLVWYISMCVPLLENFAYLDRVRTGWFLL